MCPHPQLLFNVLQKIKQIELPCLFLFCISALASLCFHIKLKNLLIFQPLQTSISLSSSLPILPFHLYLKVRRERRRCASCLFHQFPVHPFTHATFYLCKYLPVTVCQMPFFCLFRKSFHDAFQLAWLLSTLSVLYDTVDGDPFLTLSLFALVDLSDAHNLIFIFFCRLI